MEKEFTVEELVNKFVEIPVQNNTKRTELIKQIKSEKYISYALKISLCENIVNATLMDDEKHMKSQSAIRHVLTIFTLIQHYTNIDCDVNQIFTEYDLLNENGLIEEIINIIPKSEITEFNSILQMTIDDVINNNFTPQSFVTNLIEQAITALVDYINISEETSTQDVDNSVDNYVEEGNEVNEE